MNESNSVYAVMKSPKNIYVTIEKTINGHETSAYLNRKDSNWIIVFEGSDTMCRNYKTKGQLFKEKHGYSKTLSNLIKKAGVSIQDYKVIRKRRKKEQLLQSKAKHDKAIAGKKVKVKK